MAAGGARARSPRTHPLAARSALALVLTACAGAPTAASQCIDRVERWGLPSGIGEASGLAVSRAHAGILWTHNDGHEGILYALELPPGGGEARIRARVRVDVPMTDLEDLELGPCDGGWCLWLADTGDNAERRDAVSVVRIAEPEPLDGTVPADQATRYRLRFPDGPRDVEALAVLPGERVHLLSKGRSEPPTWYRVEAGADPDGSTLVPVSATAAAAPALPAQITGAAHVPDTPDRVLVRSYRDLATHLVGERDARVLPGALGLAHLAEPQGEAVAVGPDGTVYLASEAGPFGGRGGVVALRCDGDPAR